MAYLYLHDQKMSSEQAAAVLKALQEKGVRLPCPRCGNLHFRLLEGIFNQPVSGDMTAASGTLWPSPGPSVPSIVTACSRCGFLSQHALGALGLLPQDDQVANPGFGG